MESDGWTALAEQYCRDRKLDPALVLPELRLSEYYVLARRQHAFHASERVVLTLLSRALMDIGMDAQERG